MAFILGWLLGILSAILSTLGIDRIRKYHQKKEFKKGVFAELKGLRTFLAANVYVLSARYGTYDRDLLKWVHDISAEDIGITFSVEAIEELVEMLKWPDKKIAAYAKRKYVEELEKDKGIKKYYLPFLDSNLNFLSLFSIEFQRQIMQVRAKLNMLHEEIDFARYFFEKSFDSTLTPENEDVISNNFDSSSGKILRLSRQIADKITYIIQDFSD